MHGQFTMKLSNFINSELFFFVSVQNYIAIWRRRRKFDDENIVVILFLAVVAGVFLLQEGSFCFCLFPPFSPLPPILESSTAKLRWMLRSVQILRQDFSNSATEMRAVRMQRMREKNVFAYERILSTMENESVDANLLSLLVGCWASLKRWFFF